jgi:hypothetical protein
VPTLTLGTSARGHYAVASRRGGLGIRQRALAR